MVLFLVVGIPLFHMALVSVMAGRNVSGTIVLGSWYRGLLWGVPVALLLNYLLVPAEPPYTPGGLFAFFTAGHFLGPGLLALLGVGVTARHLFSERGVELFLGLTAFFCGTFTVLGVADAVVAFRHPDAYQLFLLPVGRIGVVTLGGALLTAFKVQRGKLRALYVPAALAVPCLFGPVPMLFFLNYPGYAILATVGATVVAGGLVYVVQRRYFPSIA